MKYWDASAVIPLVYPETTSPSVHAIYLLDHEHFTLATTRVEVECTIARILFEGKIIQSQAARLRHEAKKLLESFGMISSSAPVLESAILLARNHPINLRAGDALHLAAWQTASKGDPQAIEFLSLDHRLRDAALAEGARILP